MGDSILAVLRRYFFTPPPTRGDCPSCPHKVTARQEGIDRVSTITQDGHQFVPGGDVGTPSSPMTARAGRPPAPRSVPFPPPGRSRTARP